MTIINILWANRKLSNQAELDRFRGALESLEIYLVFDPDPDLIPALFLLFNDHSHIPFLQHLWAMIRKTFEFEKILLALIDVTPQMASTASFWLETFYSNLIQIPEAKTYLKQIFPLLTETAKNYIVKYLSSAIETLSEDDMLEDDTIIYSSIAKYIQEAIFYIQDKESGFTQLSFDKLL